VTSQLVSFGCLCDGEHLPHALTRGERIISPVVPQGWLQQAASAMDLLAGSKKRKKA